MVEVKAGRVGRSIDWALPVLGIVLALGLAWGIGYVQARDTEHRVHYKRAYSESAKSQASRACRGMRDAVIFECVEGYVSSASEQANGEIELSAQQRSATSALVATIFSGIALVATIIGIYFVRETLFATLKAVKDSGEATEEMKKSNSISTDNSHRELRAYLSAKSVTLKQTDWDDDKFILDLIISNNGQTPADMARVVLRAFWSFKGGVTKIIDFDEPNLFKSHRDTPMLMPWSFDGDFDGCESDGRLMVVGNLQYVDVFGKRQRETFGWITPDDEEGPFHDIAFPVNMNAYSPETVRAMIKNRRDENTL